MAKNDNKLDLKRLAIVDESLCRPQDCSLECKRYCPVNRIGKQCITVDKKSIISEELCIGCSICQKKCPFNAIKIINLPTELTRECSHRYGENMFKLHRLPIPKIGSILGLIGTNGIGKSTALEILSGKLKPNMGNYEKEPEWTEILNKYKGSELQGYFTKILENKIIVAKKIQYINQLPEILEKKFLQKNLTISEVLIKIDKLNLKEYYIEKLCLKKILDRNINNLSGGELQRFAIALTCMEEADVYIFDEPSSYLDVRQRLYAAREIRNKVRSNNYIIVVEHDLAILDLISDYGCVLYGLSGAYGIITAPQTIKNAINIFLEGFIPTENIRFRETGLKFTIQEPENAIVKGKASQFKYAQTSKNFDSFNLQIKAGEFTNSEIVVLLGENGMGKTTFVNLIAGKIPSNEEIPLTGLTVSVKPQKIVPRYKGTVRDLLTSKIRAGYFSDSFQAEIIKPMKINHLLDRQISELSGGELQRLAIIICLGTEAQLYLIDEPSAFLDSDQRIAVAKIIKRFICNHKKSAFIVEHDLVLASYLADKVIVFTGTPAISSTASEPMNLAKGMNIFLSGLDITFRRDPENFRPRINKPESTKDREQKASGNYFFVS